MMPIRASKLGGVARWQALGRLKGGVMNKTEAAYAAILEGRKLAGEVVWWAFEPFKIRLAARTFYDVDFGLMLADGRLEVHEVKGSYAAPDSLVKLKIAAEHFPAPFFLARLVRKAWTVEAVR